MSKFASVVEDIQELSPDEKEEIFFLLNQYLIEDRRDEVFRNYQESKKRKNLKFSSNIKELKARLDD